MKAHAKHKKIIEQAKGYSGRRKNVFRVATQAVTKAGQYAYRDRRQRKRQFRALWIARINAATRENGISYSRFIDGLNKLEITKRPIHCSDIKEETLYIKDNDTWEMENKNKDKMKRAIDKITDINMEQMPEWVKENPKFANDEEYLKVISNIMNVMDNSDHSKDKEKIINNVAKETLIDE